MQPRSRLALAALEGCASLPEPRAAATGEPLSVDTQRRTYPYTTKEKVGSIDTRDSRGHRTTEKHPLPKERLEAAADEYNAGLAGQ